MYHQWAGLVTVLQRYIAEAANLQSSRVYLRGVMHAPSAGRYEVGKAYQRLRALSHFSLGLIENGKMFSLAVHYWSGCPFLFILLLL